MLILMRYNLKFMPKALKFFNKLNPKIKQQFKKQLKVRLRNLFVEKYRLHGERGIIKKITIKRL